MTTLHVVIDQMVAPVPGGVGRYTEELTRQLIATAPVGADVTGIVSASPEPDYTRIAERLPGLAKLEKSVLSRRELAAAWRAGLVPPSRHGMVHATSLLAPLRRHDRLATPGEHVAVTIHDAVPWTHPETLTRHGVAWHRAMAKRAVRYADAVVVPTHAVAAELDELLGLGERVRVIGGAVGSGLRLPPDPLARVRSFELPDRYVVAVGTLEPRKGLNALIRAFAQLPDDLPLLVVGQPGWGGVDLEAVARDAGIAPDRVRALGWLDDEDLAVVLAAATVFVLPSRAEGFGLPLVEAFSFGTPVVHSDAPALVEVGGGGGLVVPLADEAGYPARLAEAIRAVVEDPKLASRLSTAGTDRAKAFTWRDSAEKVWQLHAEL